MLKSIQSSVNSKEMMKARTPSRLPSEKTNETKTDKTPKSQIKAKEETKTENPFNMLKLIKKFKSKKKSIDLKNQAAENDKTIAKEKSVEKPIAKEKTIEKEFNRKSTSLGKTLKSKQTEKSGERSIEKLSEVVIEPFAEPQEKPVEIVSEKPIEIQVEMLEAKPKEEIKIEKLELKPQDKSMMKQSTKRLDRTMDKAKGQKRALVIDKTLVDVAVKKYLNSKTINKLL